MIVFGTKTTLKLLRSMLEEPLHEFKEIELIKKAKTGKGSASNLINEMIKEKILIEKRIGKTKIISLNLQSQYVFLLKSLLDQEKMFNMPDSKLAALILFKNEVRKHIELLIVFGSSIAGTSTERSDIDLLIVCDNDGGVMKTRKKVEELLGERFNLHLYRKDEIIEKIGTDAFTQNAFLKGALIYGYDLGKELFSIMKGKEDLERLFFFSERVKSSLRNYLKKDYKTAEEIIEKTIEQLIFYLLSERGINYVSKKDAKKSIKKLSEGQIIQKIYNASLKEKVTLSERLILGILKNKILEGEGYA